MTLRLLHVFLAATTGLLLPGGGALAQSPAAGQDWPSKLVRITLPYSSGAGPAVFMRVWPTNCRRLGASR